MCMWFLFYMYKLPYLYLFRLYMGNASSALVPLLGKKRSHPLSKKGDSLPTKEEPTVHWELPISAKQTADQQSQHLGPHKSFKPNVELENGVWTFPGGWGRGGRSQPSEAKVGCLGCAGIKEELLPCIWGWPKHQDAEGAAWGREDNGLLPLPWGVSSTSRVHAIPVLYQKGNTCW